jgi:hypothetical protein
MGKERAVASERLVTVTLVRAWDAGERMEEAGRIDFALVLDASGRPDAQAWLDDPDPWPATRILPGSPAEPGDVVHDEDGWQLRFFGPDGHAPDAPPHRIADASGPLRPGEVLTLWSPEGEEAAWRIVNVSPRDG